jgi:hypothetical protein
MSEPSQSTPQQRVDQWLKKGGFGFEMQVVRSFRKRFRDVRHSRYYQDVITDELREIDVTVEHQSSEVRATLVRVHFVVECKSGNDAAPWVLFLGDEMLVQQDALALVRLMCAADAEMAPRIPRLARSVWDAPLFMYQAPHAYQIADIAKDNEIAYGAVRKVLGAADALLVELDERRIDGPPLDLFEVIVPVLVTAGPLFIVSTDHSGEPVATPETRGLLVTQMASTELRAVWVVQSDGLDAFVTDAFTSAEKLRQE